MRALQLDAEWSPRSGYVLSERERREQRAENSNQVYRDPRLALVGMPTPEPGPREALIRVKTCGVCGSDLHLYEKDADDYIISADPTNLPIVLGHEWSGVVEAVGAEVRFLRPGDPVCAESTNFCGMCAACRAAMPNYCQNLEDLGFTLNGAMAEYLVVREQSCFKLDAVFDAYGNDDRAYEAGALVEPLGVAYNGRFVRSGGFMPGGHVAVFGAGPIGLAAIAMARAAGAATVLAFDTVSERRALALRLGADQAHDPLALSRDGRDQAGLIRDATRGDGLAMAVEAAGASPWTIPVLERCMAVGGKIIQVGIGTRPTPINLVELQKQGISLYGTMGMSGSGIPAAVIRMLASGRLDASPIITARFPLDQAMAAMTLGSERRDGKILVKPG